MDVIDGTTSDASESSEVNVDDLSESKYEADLFTEEITDE